MLDKSVINMCSDFNIYGICESFEINALKLQFVLCLKLQLKSE